MDVSVNRAAKAFIEHEFQDWYANQILTNMRVDEVSESEMKHLGAKWLVRMFNHISDNPHLIVNGFIATGISDSISEAVVAGEEYDLAQTTKILNMMMKPAFPTDPHHNDCYLTKESIHLNDLKLKICT